MLIDAAHSKAEDNLQVIHLHGTAACRLPYEKKKELYENIIVEGVSLHLVFGARH